MMRTALLTGGGDAPGLNALIRAVVSNTTIRGDTIIGLDDGFRGLIEPYQWCHLTLADVTGIFREGGTILGTTNQANPFAHATRDGRVIDCSSVCVDRLRALSLDGLIVVGGDGTMAIAHELWKRAFRLLASRRPSTTTWSTRKRALDSTQPQASLPRRSTGCTRPRRHTIESWLWR